MPALKPNALTWRSLEMQLVWVGGTIDVRIVNRQFLDPFLVVLGSEVHKGVSKEYVLHKFSNFVVCHRIYLTRKVDVVTRISTSQRILRGSVL